MVYGLKVRYYRKDMNILALKNFHFQQVVMIYLELRQYLEWNWIAYQPLF